jgi:metal-sulfur cluster biosynthetic enzyme
MNEINIITNNSEKTEQAINALKFVMDPEIGLNVADLGLIYQIDYDEEEKKVFCTHTLTTQFCPMGDAIQTGVINALQQTFPEYFIEVSVVFEPHWSADRISDDGRDFLNL